MIIEKPICFLFVNLEKLSKCLHLKSKDNKNIINKKHNKIIKKNNKKQNQFR